jgi:hypothetical protein
LQYWHLYFFSAVDGLRAAAGVDVVAMWRFVVVLPRGVDAMQ